MTMIFGHTLQYYCRRYLNGTINFKDLNEGIKPKLSGKIFHLKLLRGYFQVCYACRPERPKKCSASVHKYWLIIITYGHMVELQVFYFILKPIFLITKGGENIDMSFIFGSKKCVNTCLKHHETRKIFLRLMYRCVRYIVATLS